MKGVGYREEVRLSPEQTWRLREYARANERTLAEMLVLAAMRCLEDDGAPLEIPRRVSEYDDLISSCRRAVDLRRRG